MGASIVAWLAVPALLYALSVGVGLLVERVAGFRAHPALVAPMGFCGLLCLTLAVFSLHGHGWLAAAIAVAGAVAGFAWTGRELPARLAAGWPALAAAGGYLLVLAPTLLTGHWTWTGYNFANDTSIHYVLASWLQDHGTVHPPAAVNTSDDYVRVYLETRYPIGTHSVLATLSELLTERVEVVYEAFLATMAGLGAMALATLSRRTMGPAPAAAAAVVAIAANLTYQYALQGGIKELGMLVALGAAAGLAYDLLASSTPVRSIVGVAVALAGALATYAIAAVPYIGLVAVALLAAMLFERRGGLRRAIGPAAGLGVGVLVVLALPTLVGIVRSAQTVSGTFETGGSDPLAQLARPIPFSQVSGVYLQGEYGFPIANPTASDITAILSAVALVLAVIGLVVLAWRRDWGPLLFLAPLGLTFAILSGQVTPYGDAKMLALMSAGVVLAALCGAIGLPRPIRLAPARAAAAGLLAVVVAGGVLASAAFAYHAVRLAPDRRLDALRQAAQHLPRSGQVNSLEAEEFAKHFAQRPNLDLGFEAITPRFAEPRDGGGTTLQYYDADDLKLGYVESFDGLILRRGPAASRPPANYAPVFVNPWYVVWRKQPGIRVLRHVPLQALDRRSLVARDCGPILEAARLARAPSRRLVASVRQPVVLFDTVAAPKPHASTWLPMPDERNPGVLRLVNPGLVSGTVRVDAPGRYRVWLRGSVGRPIAIYVDRRHVGDAQGRNSNEQYLRAGFVDLRAGRHTVEVRRGGGGLDPGDGAPSYIGPLALERMGPSRLETIDPRRARSLCSRSLDWVEVVQR
jgi:hypothetical protein